MSDPSSKRKQYSDFLEAAKGFEQKEEWDTALEYYKKALTVMEYLFKCKSITHPFLGEKDNPKLKAMYKQNL